jgi:hypothetical protein
MEFYKIGINDNRINLDLKEQSAKVEEELQELLEEVNKSMNNELTYLEELHIIDNMYSECFDVIQACITFLSILESCTSTSKDVIESKYVKHIEKLVERKWKIERL